MGNWISALARALRRFQPGSSARREEDDAGKPTPEYAIDAHVATDIGCVRETNQDAVALVRPPSNEETTRRGLLAIVADGMGGHKGGAVASALAVETVCQRYFAETGEEPARALELAMQEANRVIYSAAQSNPALEGMGTTATALVIIDHDVIYAHVGDSRLYRCAQGRCAQLTEDDSLVEQMVRNGIISACETYRHPFRSVLLRSLGTAESLEIHAQRGVRLHGGETFVLCSDGLHDGVGAKDIVAAVDLPTAEAACRRLIDLACERDGSDNISVGVVAVRAEASFADTHPA
ncbi:MAG: protein phosphatase 2C domain-containing protein [Candidatus Accumulibacter sp.]|uniref:protein phosphatase 2C domain-containing protein n=1 Tax=Accumulibacter sp. TaxID=2053492 RepID=UPI00287824EF|nr:protein phosphatase 2C domain-containing protein [Accumulibacter sp.]MDS4013935.1 protein phosphatase 2C domain-containing protein [Accumulibacter sp.]